MPLYEYQCEKCGGRFEVIQKFSDSPVTEHEGCGGGVRKLLSAPAIQFKGTGWYVTDYARSGQSDGKAEGQSESKAEGKSDSKAEGKSDSKSAKSESSSDSKDSGSKSSDKKSSSDSKSSSTTTATP